MGAGPSGDGTDVRSDGRTDGRTGGNSPSVLQDFVPFGSAAQKPEIDRQTHNEPEIDGESDGDTETLCIGCISHFVSLRSFLAP